jgi:hypothetical protein
MTFVGQFRVDVDGDVRMAYVFMTGSDEYVDGTWEPEGGENAVIVQPDGKVPAFVDVRDVGHGPCWPREDHVPVDDQAAAAEGADDQDDEGPWQFLCGEPQWLQGDETLARAGGCSVNWTMAWATTSVMPVLPTSSCRLTATKVASSGSAGDVVVFRGLVLQAHFRATSAPLEAPTSTGRGMSRVRQNAATSSAHCCQFHLAGEPVSDRPEPRWSR